MSMHFSDAEGRVLHGLLRDTAGDIVVRLDEAGFVIHASDNAEDLGMDLSSLLLMPHISDFAERGHGNEVARYVSSVFNRKRERSWIEFPVLACETEESCEHTQCRRWYALSLRVIEPDDGVPQGALGLIRSVQHQRRLESEISAHAHTDPVTGLANRQAFGAGLHRMIDAGEEGCMAVFAVDQMRAIFMQYGQATIDEIQWGFAKFLEAMIQPEQKLAQLDKERFAVLLPGQTVRAAREWAADLLQTFSGLTMAEGRGSSELTASAGLARIEMTVDWTQRQAELGLVMARAGGGKQIGFGGRIGGLSGSGIVPDAFSRFARSNAA